MCLHELFLSHAVISGVHMLRHILFVLMAKRGLDEPVIRRSNENKRCQIIIAS